MRLPTQQEAVQHIEEQGLPRTGYVQFYRGRAVGWSRDLDASRFEPGVVAVDVKSGAAMRATGGDYWKGARRWEQVQHADGPHG